MTRQVAGLLVLLVLLLVLLSSVDGFGRSSLGARLKRHLLQTTQLDLTPASDVLQGARQLGLGASLVLSEGVGESYESSGVPLWVPILCFTLTGITLATPVIWRQALMKNNSRKRGEDGPSSIIDDGSSSSYDKWKENNNRP
jgi:hypothetical protein